MLFIGYIVTHDMQQIAINYCQANYQQNRYVEYECEYLNIDYNRMPRMVIVDEVVFRLILILYVISITRTASEVRLY